MTRVTDLIDLGLRLRYQEQEGQREPGLHLSMVGKCPRQTYKTLIGEVPTNPPDDTSLQNFAVGQANEEWIADALRAVGATIIRERRVAVPLDGTVAVGHPDILAEIEVDGVLALIEAKWTNERAFRYREKQGPIDDHVSQLNQYVHASQLGLLPHKYAKGILLYAAHMPKGSRNRIEFEVPYDSWRALSELDGLLTIHGMAERGEEPAIPLGFEKNRFPCGYCQFQKGCWR